MTTDESKTKNFLKTLCFTFQSYKGTFTIFIDLNLPLFCPLLPPIDKDTLTLAILHTNVNVDIEKLPPLKFKVYNHIKLVFDKK